MYSCKGLAHPSKVQSSAIAVLASLTIGLGSSATVSAQTYRLSDGFSASNNPNGLWSFGYVTNIGAPFHLLQVPHVSPTDGLMIPSWQLTSFQTPAVYYNHTTNTAVVAGGQGVFPPQTVWYYPGEDGRTENFGVIRFTVPASGTYQLETGVAAVYNGALSGDTDFHVAINGGEVFGQFVPTNGTTGYTNSLSLSSGDVVDFVIGRGQDGSAYASGLKIHASLNHIPAPPASGVFDVSEGFSAGSNPNAPWAYGWVGSLGGSFTLLTVPHISTVDSGAKIPSWQLTSGQAPVVCKNVSNATLTAGQRIGLGRAKEVWFNPGENGQPENFGVIGLLRRATAFIRLRLHIWPVYSGSPQGDTDFHVLKNGVELFGRFLAPSDTASYSNTVALNSGDMVDFAIGRGSDGNAYGSGLRIAAVLLPAGPLPDVSADGINVVLKNAAATFSQSGGWDANLIIDGITNDFAGWAVYDFGRSGAFSETVVVETETDIGFASGSLLTFGLYHVNHNPQCGLGHFRLSYTTDSRDSFADGLNSGGDVSANWIVLSPKTASATDGVTLTVQSDGSILASGTNPAKTVYTITAEVAALGITGFRIESMEDSSLPDSGPGRSPNGNFVLTEFTVSVSELHLPASGVFDVSEGFSAGSNPNAPWAYGWVGSLGGSFTLLTVPHISTVDSWVVGRFIYAADGAAHLDG